jgi:hypothetical protein
MKTNTKIVAAAATLLIVVLCAVTFDACRKKNEVANSFTKLTDNQGIVYQKNVQDRTTYIVEFEKKLKSVEKSDEFLTVENANSFLFDILNYDYGDIQQNKLAMSYETTTYTVNVSNGVINLTDFANLYQEISAYISEYYHNLDLINPHYYYIFPKIEEFDSDATSATVTVETAVSSGDLGKAMAYNDDFCDYFPEDSLYNWIPAADTLEYYFNLQCPSCYVLETGRYYFSDPTPVLFTYQNYSQLFFCSNCAGVNFTSLQMCQYLNDYWDIAMTYAINYGGLCIMSCDVIPIIGYQSHDGAVPMYHNLIVYYSTVIYDPINPGQ